MKPSPTYSSNQYSHSLLDVVKWCSGTMLTQSVSHPLWLSDAYERDLVEVVLEVAVSHISQRQRDMLLRQIGVLLGVLDSDIVVREIGAFNEYR